MRRLLAFFVLCACPLLVAAAPKAKPTPTPAPVSSPTALPANAPVVLIYPFETPTDLDAKYGGAIAQIYAQVLTETGGVKVLPIPEKIKREDYQTYARIQHADYYISGFIQPIGQTASIVSQVVDVSNNISVYSATTQIADVQDIGSQALNARSVILEAAGIDRPQLQSGSAPANTPTPSATGGASVPITSIVTDLFRGKPHAKTPSATPTPSGPKPSRGVIVAGLIGSADRQTLHAASDELFRAMDEHYKTTMSSVVTANLLNQADSICGAHRDNTIASGLLDVQHVGGFHAHDTYTFTLKVYACFGAVLYTDTEKNDDYARAIHAAVEAYYGEHPENNG